MLGGWSLASVGADAGFSFGAIGRAMIAVIQACQLLASVQDPGENAQQSVGGNVLHPARLFEESSPESELPLLLNLDCHPRNLLLRWSQRVVAGRLS